MKVIISINRIENTFVLFVSLDVQKENTFVPFVSLDVQKERKTLSCYSCLSCFSMLKVLGRSLILNFEF